LQSAAHAAQLGTLGDAGEGGGQHRQQAGAVGALRAEMLSAVRSAVAGATGGSAVRRGADGGLCKNCYQAGHKFYECTNPVVCQRCPKPGHKQGGAVCGET